MAHGMMANSLVVHQALHGYAEGHRQLALSTKLAPRDQKTLLAHSDISGVGARLGSEGYLTGYPLADSGVYALARTWPAKEMSRPGCVWTHTLLLDFADLAVCDSLTALVDAFDRPSIAGGFAQYKKTRQILPSGHEARVNWPDVLAQQLISALYGYPKARLISRQTWPDIESLILAIWSQQWPRLRRGFRFCTFAASDRSSEAAPFDIQILSSVDRHTRSRFDYSIDVESISPLDEAWVFDAVQDLRDPDRNGLRAFFRKLGSDVLVGREAFKPLSQLHVTMQALTSDPAAIVNAFRLVQNDLGEEARTARSMIARVALEHVDLLDNQTFNFLWSAAKNFDDLELKRSGGALGIAAWRKNPELLVPLQADERLSRLVVEPTFESLEVSDLLGGLEGVPSLIPLALSVQPKILAESRFWRQPGNSDAAFDAARHFGRSDTVVEAIIGAERNDLARRAAHEFGYEAILRVVEKRYLDGGEPDAAWLRALAADPISLAQYMVSDRHFHKSFLCALAHMLGPDSLWSDSKRDPWLQAWLQAHGTLTDKDATFMAAFFLARALGYRAQYPAELTQFGFEPTYAALEKGELAEVAWRLLDDRLPLSIFWFQDDRSGRLLSGVVNLFIRRELSPDVFGHLVRDGKLFFSLAENMAESGRGRRYLKSVRDALASDRGAGMRARVEFIDRLLK